MNLFLIIKTLATFRTRGIFLLEDFAFLLDLDHSSSPGPQQGSPCGRALQWDTPIGHSNIGPSIFGAPMGSRLAVTLGSLRLCTSTALCAALDIPREAAHFLLGKLALLGYESSCNWQALGLACAHGRPGAGQSAGGVSQSPPFVVLAVLCGPGAWFASKCKFYQLQAKL